MRGHIRLRISVKISEKRTRRYSVIVWVNWSIVEYFSSQRQENTISQKLAPTFQINSLIYHIGGEKKREYNPFLFWSFWLSWLFPASFPYIFFGCWDSTWYPVLNTLFQSKCSESNLQKLNTINAIHKYSRYRSSFTEDIVLKCIESNKFPSHTIRYSFTFRYTGAYYFKSHSSHVHKFSKLSISKWYCIWLIEVIHWSNHETFSILELKAIIHSWYWEISGNVGYIII